MSALSGLAAALALIQVRWERAALAADAELVAARRERDAWEDRARAAEERARDAEDPRGG